ncbi:hypothetical protein [Collinsella sp. Sow4_E3]|uniref:hypothetical protein n=1 Tax=Collinsella sp. Sow4_E3 TaxID=3438776 RepID=UPI003F8FFDBF
MTYCEQILNQIYQNFMFSVGVYRYDQNLLDLLYKQTMTLLAEKLQKLREANYPHGEILLYGNHYRRLITRYYYSQAMA